LWEKISGKKIAAEDLLLVDVWTQTFYAIHAPDDDVDKIRETDTTFAYELRPAKEFEVVQDTIREERDENSLQKSKRKPCKRFALDIPSITAMNTGEQWKRTLERYVVHSTRTAHLLNPKRGTIDQRIDFYKKLESFIDDCYCANETDDESDDIESGQDTHEKSNFPESGQDTRERLTPREQSDFPACRSPSGKTFTQVSEASMLFHNVETSHDVASLEFASKKFRQFALDLIRENRLKFKEGLTIQITLNTASTSSLAYSASDRPFASPLCLRVAPTTTVYQFRQELAKRLPIKFSDDADPLQPRDPMQIVCQIPLTYEPKKTYSSYRSFSMPSQLGMLDKGANSDESRPVTLASPDDESEQQLLSGLVGQNGAVALHWPSHLCQLHFDDDRHEKSVEVNPIKQSRHPPKTITVNDCIEKYCQMEQLDESEMWYCDRCKKHVRAWKQFHLYRTPPILIVHLKRFHYSATTHRRDKIDTDIDFPLKGLDLTGEVMQFSDDKKPIYDCYAVSNHYGRLGGGHYTAYAMSDDGEWCHFDDSRVTTGIDPSAVVSNAAYVLYYKRRDLVVSKSPATTTLPALIIPAIVGEDDDEDDDAEVQVEQVDSSNDGVQMEVDDDVMEDPRQLVADDSSTLEGENINNGGMNDVDGNNMLDTERAFNEGPDSFESSFPAQ